MKRSMITGMLALALVSSFGCKDNKKPDSQPATNATTSTTTNNDTAGAAADAETTQTAAAADDADDADENTWEAKFDTTAGEFIVEVHPDWAPNGAARFRELVEAGYYTDIAAFRVIDGFMAQFGIHGDPAMNKEWRDKTIQDDPPVDGVSNKRGYITYAMRGPNTRTTQLFINFRDNTPLDGQGFRPFGVVKDDGMKVVDGFYKGYGEGAPRGKGPDQGRLQAEGNKYLKESFPELDYIKTVTIVGEDGTGAAAQDDGAKPADGKPADDKPTAPKKAWQAGAYADGSVKAAGMEEVKLQLSLNDDGSVNGKIQGKREGKGFAIAIKGSVNDEGTITAEGSKGPNNLKLRAKAKDGAVKGSLMGKINDKGARGTFNATK